MTFEEWWENGKYSFYIKADIAEMAWEARVPEGYKVVSAETPEYAEIYVGGGLFAKVDWCDFDLVKPYKWNRTGKDCSVIYAQAWDQSEAPRKRLRMHSMILPTKDVLFVDHINGDGLDNRRSNLRVVSKQENCFNMRSNRGTSKYKGVSFDKDQNKWRAYITHNRKRINIGRFHEEKDAAIAYDSKAKELFGDNAFLNFGAN